MKASIIELRTKMKEIGNALSRQESVIILSHGKPFASLQPLRLAKTEKKVKSHAFFGLDKSNRESVELTIEKLRGGRY